MSELRCLRCKTVPLTEAGPSDPRIAFFECPSCRRQYALRPGKQLTFRWLHPISLALYAGPVRRVACPAGLRRWPPLLVRDQPRGADGVVRPGDPAGVGGADAAGPRYPRLPGIGRGLRAFLGSVAARGRGVPGRPAARLTRHGRTIRLDRSQERNIQPDRGGTYAPSRGLRQACAPAVSVAHNVTRCHFWPVHVRRVSWPARPIKPTLATKDHADGAFSCESNPGVGFADSTGFSNSEGHRRYADALGLT